MCRGLLGSRRAGRRGVLVLSVAALAGMLGVLVTAAPAGAHAELVSSDPAQGAAVRSLPSTVTLTFSEPVRTPAFVEVTAPDGTNVASGDPRIVDEELTQRVGDSASGGRYAVAYRITSADGHAISGTVQFSVRGDNAEADSEATDAASQGPAPPAPATPESSPAATGDPAGGIGTTQLLLLLAVLAAGLVAVGIGTRRALRHSATMVEERRDRRSPRR